MRALTRMRTLAAALALLLFLTSTALANVPSRPIDRPEGPPEPNPTEVGEPDTGHGGLPMLLRHLVLAAQLSSPALRRFTIPMLQSKPRSAADLRQSLRGGGPR